jgi:ABC-type Fe3+ transport system substrate-binding protein
MTQSTSTALCSFRNSDSLDTAVCICNSNAKINMDHDLHPMHFFGNMAFSLNLSFMRDVKEMAYKHRKETGKELRYHIPIPGDSMEIMEGCHTKSADILPEVIASIGFENIFQPDFQKKFISSGTLRAAPLGAVHPSFNAAGLTDPEGQYSIHAVTPYVFLIDKGKLGDIEPPESWKDILHPRFKNNVICNGSRKNISYILLFYIYRMAGLEGVRCLAGNLRDAIHAGLIARIAGRPASSAAVYIVPWFFAQVCPWTDNTAIIWPSDGAIVSPMWLMTKNTVSQEGELFIRMITGIEFGNKAASVYSPVSNAAVNNRLPKEAKFQWLGWEFVHDCDLIRLKNKLLAVFLSEWRPFIY